jgi:hypothetical protein
MRYESAGSGPDRLYSFGSAVGKPGIGLCSAHRPHFGKTVTDPLAEGISYNLLRCTACFPVSLLNHTPPLSCAGKDNALA